MLDDFSVNILCIYSSMRYRLIIFSVFVCLYCHLYYKIQFLLVRLMSLSVLFACLLCIVKNLNIYFFRSIYNIYFQMQPIMVWASFSLLPFSPLKYVLLHSLITVYIRIPFQIMGHLLEICF